MTVPSSTDHVAALQASPRQPLPDQLRGFALLGIVLVNAPFLGISAGAGTTSASAEEPVDRAVAMLVVALAQGKFYLLFAFLFGYGLTLLLRRLDDEGMRRYRRRLVGLAVLGLAHAVFLFIGDILLSYAVLGCCLLLVVRRSDRAVLWIAAASYFVALFVLALVAVSVVLDPAVVSADPLGNSAVLDAAVRGSFTEAAAARANALPGVLVFLAAFNWAQAFAMFCLGLLAGRRGLLATPERHNTLWRRLLVVASTVGLPCGVAAAWLTHGPDASPMSQTLGAVLSFAAAPALSGGYVALLALATRSRAANWFAASGQMSLTVYLLESVLLSAVFAGWGLGLLGEYGAAAVAAVGLAVWLALEVAASLWLRRFRYGPFEWLLRAWSYRQWPPLRRN